MTTNQSALISANQINSDTAWIALLEIVFKDGQESIKVCRNNEDISWNGHLWQAFPFTVGENKRDNKGTLSNITIEVDNSTRDLEYYLNLHAGGAGCSVILRVVRSDDLENSVPDLEEYFSVKSTQVTESKVTFTLGNSYPPKARRPFRRYMKNNCPFKYKGLECGCTSSLPTCNHTLPDCRARNNSKRFGGFPGIPQGGLYV